MLIKELLTEGLSHPVIVVDVQPAYSTFAPRICSKIVEFVNKQTGPVLMYVNADQHGLTDDTIPSIKDFWEDNGFDPDGWRRVKIEDKGYGYFRGAMDSGVPDALIIKCIRLLYQYKLNDSRNLFGGEDSDTYEESMQKHFGEYADTFINEPLYVNWTNVALLKQFSGAYIVGGGRNECLREVELLMNAFNVKYRRIDSLVY